MIKVFAIVALITIIGLMAIIAYLLILIRNNKVKLSGSSKNSEELDFSKEIVARLKAPNSRLKEEFIKIIRAELTNYAFKNQNSSSRNTVFNTDSIIDEAATRAQDWVMEQLRREGVFSNDNIPTTTHTAPVSLNQDINNNRENKASTKTIYYATAVDEDGKTFCEVTSDFIRGESVFKLTEEKQGECSFEVCEEAYSMVLKESEYLKGACNLNREGSSKVITVSKGRSLFNEEANKWEVKEPAKVTFE